MLYTHSLTTLKIRKLNGVFGVSMDSNNDYNFKLPQPLSSFVLSLATLVVAIHDNSPLHNFLILKVELRKTHCHFLNNLLYSIHK